MTKNIQLLVISHSFLKKINTSLYSVLKHKHNIELKLISPKSHYENNKVIQPDYKNDELDLDITFKETLFNHLRFKIYKGLIGSIRRQNIKNIILDMDLLSLQSIILLFYVIIIWFSNDFNQINEYSALIWMSLFGISSSFIFFMDVVISNMRNIININN